MNMSHYTSLVPVKDRTRHHTLHGWRGLDQRGDSSLTLITDVRNRTVWRKCYTSYNTVRESDAFFQHSSVQRSSKRERTQHLYILFK